MVYKSENLVQNEKTGSITLENLKPEECLSLISEMHKKKFLSRQIFVTSVVSNSPVKPLIRIQPENSSGSFSSPSQPKPADNLPPNLGNPLLLKPPSTTKSSDSVSPASPGVQDKINFIEKQTSPTPHIVPETASKSRLDKRKSEASPESDELSRKEKKMLREEERKQDKMREKLEYREKKTIKCPMILSY